MSQSHTHITSLRAGVAKSDITTDALDVVVHDRLYAKVLALDDGSTRIIMISMDAVAIGGICDVRDDFLQRLRDRISHDWGIDGRYVMVHATHTHPPGRILCDDDQQVERVYDAVRCALDNLAPVRIAVGRGREERIQINRTLMLKDGRGWTIRQTNPCPPCEDVGGLGPVDPEIGVIRLDRMDGRPLVVLYNYACHPLVGVPGGAVTANYPGFASSVIEDHLGHGAMALFIQGAAGDVTEVLYKDVNHPRDAESIGMMLGLSVLNAIRDVQAEEASLSIRHETVDLPRRTDIPERLTELERERERMFETLRYTSLNFKTFLPMCLRYALDKDYPSDYAYRYLREDQIGASSLREMDKENQVNLQKYMDNIHTMEKLARIQDQLLTLRRHQRINHEAGSPTITAEIQGIQIGKVVIITAPIELLTQTGLDIKQLSPFEHTFVAAFTNGYMHYGPSPADYDRGDYEVMECFLAPQWEKIYMDKVKEILYGL